MSGLFIPDRGRQIPKVVNLTTTSATTIMDGKAKDSGTLMLESLRWSVKGTNTDLSIWLTDGTNSYYLMDAETKTARSSGTIKDEYYQLQAGWSLKALASQANQIDILAVFALSTGQDAPR